MEEVQIRSADRNDREEWTVLWHRYSALGNVTLPTPVVDATSVRIMAPDQPVHCLVATDDAGVLLGFCNVVLHPDTWSDRPVCYLQDLYVREDRRRLGISGKLLAALGEWGRHEDWHKIYWITRTGNAAARAAYDRIAKQIDYVRYEMSP